MLEQLIYKNHQNEVFEFGKDGIYVNLNELHDYEWKVQKQGNRISGFEYGITKKKLPIIIICDTEKKAISAKNKLLEIVEKDVLAFRYGQIILGDYYMRCFVTKSQKKDYLKASRYLSANLTLTTDFPYWVKETATAFNTATVSSDAYLDYPVDYPFDFKGSTHNNSLTNSSFVDTNFKIIIYGACTNPSITIGGHVYQVNCTVGEGEYLTIDSTSKKIYLTANGGAVSNKFNGRNRESYIFKKIPSGAVPVTWDGTFSFDVILCEERSEPKWI